MNSPLVSRTSENIASAVASQQPQDDVLVRACLAGDSSAFVALVRRHERAARGSALAAVGANGPFEDALQEGLLKAYKSLRSFKQGASFQSWLCRIVHNAAIDETRRISRIKPTAVEQLNSAPVPNFDTGVVNNMALRQALNALPQKQRAALILVDVEGFDYTTAGQMLGVPSGTIASRVSSARNILRLSFPVSPKDGAK